MELRLIVEAPDGTRQAHALVGPLALGRDEGADVCVADPMVSRRHVLFEPTVDGVRISDLGSTHGTRIDGRALTEPEVLAPGARVEAGSTSVVVEAVDSPAPGPGRADPSAAPAAGELGVIARKGVEVRYREGSAGAAAAPAVADIARRARRALAGFGSEADGEPVVLSLVDPFPDPREPEVLVTAGTVVHDGQAWMVVTPEAPPDDPHRAVALVLAAPLPAAAVLAHVVEGYGLWLSRPADPTPEDLEAHPGPLEALGGSARVTLLPSFVGYLVDLEGEDALRRLLASPADRVNQAWDEIYGRSAAALERAWRATRDGEARDPNGTTTFLRMSWSYLKPYRWRQGEVFVYLLLSLVFTSAYPFVTRRLFDTALPSGSLRQVLELLGVLAVAFAISLVAGLRQGYLTSGIGASVVRDLRSEMFARVQRLPDAWLARHTQGDVLSRMMSDAARVQSGLTTAISDGLFQAISLLVSAVIMLAISPVLGGLVLLGAPIVAVVYRKMAGGALKRSLTVSQDSGAVIQVAAENHQALPVVKAFGLAGREEARFARASDRLVRSQLRLSLYGGLFGVSVNGITTAIRLIAIGLGAWLIFEGHLTVGGLVAFLGIMGEVLAPVTGLTDLGQKIQESLGSLARLDDILKAPSEPDDEGEDLAPLAHDIRLEDVAVSYTAERRALDAVDLTIAAGSRVAVVGPSGSGKSTLLRVLLRQYEPDQGRLLLDGVDVTERSLSSLRAQIGVVFQDSFLFDGTIRENIALGAPDATDEQIRAAARAAEVDAFVADLPRGDDTLVGPGGSNLSGGQRQRVALARALVRDPRILLLDEATSALDPRTERQISRTLATVAEGRTTISVTHRLASVVDYDRIVVVVDGRIVEVGGHDDLVARGGAYAHLWAEQTGTELARTAAPFDADAALARLPLFAALSRAARSDVAAHLRPVHAAAGDLVAEADGTLVIVARGRARATTATGARQLRPGDTFGLAAALGDASPAALTATEDLVAHVLDPEAIELLTARHPAIAAARAGRTTDDGPHSGVVLAPAPPRIATPPRRGPRPTAVVASPPPSVAPTQDPGPGAAPGGGGGDTIRITVTTEADR